ncbi:MAG: CheR family methyltransferase, partial [Henriciella sp.]|uniref:CheR family methyltransferase n=1 Tax=Henriciella sp. TaxID=1968823 RepID=UPI003C76701F
MTTKKTRDFAIAGIGASAGGVEALEAFFKGLPDDPGIAFMVVTHLNPDRESHLHEIIARYTKLKVVVAKQGVRVRKNCVYVLPAGAVLGFKHGELQISEQTSAKRERKPIDVFLSALALECGERCAAIILSGGNTDGTLGLKAVKERGGLTMAQVADGGGPMHPDMPESAISTGLVDLAIPASEMGEKLVAFARSMHLLDALETDDAETEKQEELTLRARIYDIMKAQVGHDFSGYKVRTFLRRVQRRINVTQVADLEAYVTLLQEDATEVNTLFRDLLINVTNFFRDAEPFEKLKETVIPALFEGRRESANMVRVWVPGCATGEEVYSIAILMAEFLAESGAKTQIQIFATDIDDHALGVARAGRYPAALLEEVSAERLERYFVKDAESYTIAKKIRDMCIFSPHSIIRDPPFSRIDLVSCRNLLIYFGPEVQGQVIPTFHYALRPGGYLFLGTSENISQYSDLFSPIDKKARIFRAKEDHLGRARIPFPLENLGETSSPSPPLAPNAVKGLSFRQSVESVVADQFAPAHIVANRDGDIVYYSGKTGKYLEAAPGAPTRQFFSLARKSLRLEARAVFREAVETGRRAVRDGIPVENDEGRIQHVSITVSPLPSDTDAEPLYIVLFADQGPVLRPDQINTYRSENTGDDLVEELEQDARETRERLQSVIEEYETSLEELKSSNEELVSVNEELQSTNEELEASKEELQSLNEELQTVNGELAGKVDELDAANSDLENLFDNTQTAMVFLKTDLTIRTFTPAMEAVLNILPGDRGRPLTDLSGNFDLPSLKSDVRNATQGEMVERQLETSEGHHYLVRFAPYRDSSRRTEGAVVTFVDVTTLVEAEQHQAILVSELNHRVKNMLGVVIALARRTAKTSDSVEAFTDTYLPRLTAMAGSYELLSKDRWKDAPLRQLVKKELVPFSGKQVHVEGPDIRLPPKKAMAFGMILHELATNASKYGALSRSAGRVDVSWSENEGRVELTWTEKNGPALGKEIKPGFGTKLIENETKISLDGKVKFDFTKDGLH